MSTRSKSIVNGTNLPTNVWRKKQKKKKKKGNIALAIHTLLSVLQVIIV